MVSGLADPSRPQSSNSGGFKHHRGPPQQRGGGGFGGGWFGNDTFEPFQQHAPQPGWDRRRQTPPPVREDFSKAPPPEKRDPVPERRILVLGDGQADRLAHGFASDLVAQPELVRV